MKQLNIRDLFMEMCTILANELYRHVHILCIKEVQQATDFHFARWNNIIIISNTKLRLLFSVTLILCFVCELNLILNGTVLMGLF